MTTAHAFTLTFHGRSGLLAAVPGLLGFLPRESLVLLCLNGSPARVGPVMRVDLAADPGEAVPELTRYAHRFGPAVAAIAYSSMPRCPPLLAAVLAASSPAGVAVLDAILVHRGLAAGVGPGGLIDWPQAEPVPGEGDPQVERMRTAVALTGRRVLPDRESVEQSVAAPVGPAAATARVAVDQAAGRILRLVECARGGVPDLLTKRLDEILTDIDARDFAAPAGLDRGAELAVLTQDPTTRDHLVGRVVRETGRDWISLLLAVGSAVPDPEATGVLGVLAVAAYHRGDGALAQVTLDRCLAAEPSHRLARLMRSAIASGLTPARLAELADPPADELNPGTAR